MELAGGRLAMPLVVMGGDGDGDGGRDEGSACVSRADVEKREQASRAQVAAMWYPAKIPCQILNES